MDAIENDEGLSKWFSTYGLVTAQRIMERLKIDLPSHELITVIKSPFGFYHQLLQIPLKNILNGIILQQAYDYHVYAQKLFIDYLLSGENSKGPEAQGASTREALESERQMLTTLGENFNKLQLEHQSLIARSQASLIKVAEQWKKVFESGLNSADTTLKNNGHDIKKSILKQGVDHALLRCDFIKAKSLGNEILFIETFNEIPKLSLNEEMKNKILNDFGELLDLIVTFDSQFDSFAEATNEMNEQSRSYRTQFYETILRVLDLIKLVPDYKINPEQDVINREPIYFDNTLG